MAAFNYAASCTILFWVLHYMEAPHVATLNYILPVIGILLSIPFLREHPTRHLLAGGTLVLLGVYIAECVLSP